MDHNTVLIILNVAVILGEIALGLVFKNYLPAYATEKGKNLATKEDIEEITRKVEGVKDEFARGREEIVHQNRQLLDYMNRRHQLRLAALDKRLAVHQEAYALWRKFAAKGNFQEVARECDKWWDKNCLYLEADARRAFRQAYYCASYIEAIEAGKHSISLEEGWQRINEAGDVILKAVELPSLGEDEYAHLKEEGKDNQPAKPDSAG